jgi:hypothetical protein
MAPQWPQHLQQGLFGARICAGGGLVQQQHGRTPEQGARQACSALRPWPNQWLTDCTSMAAPAMAGVVAVPAKCSAAITI